MPPAVSLSEALDAVTAALPGGGEHRPGQRQMAVAVEAALARRRHLVAQAGTGTGKTLAYLLPALLSDRPVVVATATRALQDQLADHDLPLVRRVVGNRVPVRFAVLKGRANYLCRQRAAEVAGHRSWDDLVAHGGWEDPLAGGRTPGDDATAPATLASRAGPATLPGLADPATLPGLADPATLPGLADPATLPGFAGTPPGRGLAVAGAGPSPADPADGPAPAGRVVAEVRRLLAWAGESASGERATLPFEPHPRAWAMVSVGPRECPGAFRCPSGGSCFAERARAAAAEAQIVVVNTSLYTSHLAADRALLPEHDAVVFDEAHEVEEIVSRGLGVELTAGRLRAAVAGTRGLVADDDRAAADALADSAERLEQLLAGTDNRRVRLAGGEPHVPGTDDGLLADLLALARARLSDLSRALRRAGDEEAGVDLAGPPGAAGAARRQRALLAAGHLADDLDVLLDPTRDQVVWISGGGTRTPTVRAAPVEVGPLLARHLWAEVTGVLASATMPPGLAGRLGMAEDATDRIDVGSPFPYRRNTLLYVPTAIGDRRRPGADAAAHRELQALLLAAGGRTLALFTSWRAMAEAVAAVRGQVPFEVLAQGDAPKPVLLRRFADEEQTCLFATMSFWQGVDVPGRSASVVVIDRLPFPRPDDPLFQARRERAGPGAFAAVDLPRAATLLAQGAGRLVRRATDTGVVAVLDPRLARAGYRRVLLDALPPMRRTVDRAEVERFLEQVTGAGTRPADAGPGRPNPPQ